MAKVSYIAIKLQEEVAWIKSICSIFKYYSPFIENSSCNSEEEVRIVYYPLELTKVKLTERNVDFSGLKHL